MHSEILLTSNTAVYEHWRGKINIKVYHCGIKTLDMCLFLVFVHLLVVNIYKYDRLRKTILDLIFFPTFGIGLKNTVHNQV